MSRRVGFNTLNVGLLALLTFSFVVGEIARYLVASTSKYLARSFEYGTKKCYVRANVTSEMGQWCPLLQTEAMCKQAIDPFTGEKACEYLYSGQGIEYQILAGPIFVVVYTSCGVLMGFLGDRIDRTRVLSWSVLLFGVSGTLIGFASDFWQLILLRMLVAAGESAVRPLGVSLISELFPASTRGVANGVFALGVYVGYGVSFVLGNEVPEANLFNLGWRPTYFVCALAIPMAFLFCCFKDPRLSANSSLSETRVALYTVNRSTESESTSGRSASARSAYWRVSLSTVSQPSFLLLLAAACIRQCAGISWSNNAQLYLEEYYPGFEPGFWIAGTSIFGGSFGVVVGGVFSDSIATRLGLHARLWILSICLIVAAPLAAGVLTFAPPTAFYCLLAYYVFSETWFSVLFTVLADIVPEEVRSLCVGLFLFVMNQVGGNLPVVLELIKEAASYRTALYIFFAGLVALSGILFGVASIPLYVEYRHARAKADCGVGVVVDRNNVNEEENDENEKNDDRGSDHYSSARHRRCSINRSGCIA